MLGAVADFGAQQKWLVPRRHNFDAVTDFMGVEGDIAAYAIDGLARGDGADYPSGQPKLIIDKLPCGNGYSVKRRPPGFTAVTSDTGETQKKPNAFQAHERVLFAVHGPARVRVRAH